MINTLPPQLPEEIAAARRRHDEVVAERWPLIVGLVGTVLIHLLTIITIRQMPLDSDSAVVDDVADLRAKYDKQELTFMLADEATPPKQLRFVEVNPDAPENDPGKTDNYGARNQQSAQPEPGKDHSDRGKTKGEMIDSTAIVTGSREPPVEAAPMAGNNGENGTGMQAVVVGAAAQPKAEAPLPGFEKIIGDNPDGLGTAIGQTPGDKADVDKKTEGKKDGTDKGQLLVAANGGGLPGVPGRPSPRPRPKVQNVRSAVLANQQLDASAAGVIGVNSRLSEAGVWWAEFIDTVDAQFQKSAGEMSTRPPSRSTVVIYFMVNAQGGVRILNVEGEATAGRVATYTCLDAVSARAPYRPWTQEMINLFGTEEEVTFSFTFW